MYHWYEQHLGIKRQKDEGVSFHLRRLEDASQANFTAWAIFPQDTKYFNPSNAPFMLNYQVEDLDAVLEALRAEGVTIEPKREDYDYGRFAWIVDPEGNRIELWAPPRDRRDRP